MRYNLRPRGNIEQRIQRQLREAIVAEIRNRHMSTQELANRLDMLPSGANALLQRDIWPIEVALQVAESLDMRVELRACA